MAFLQGREAAGLGGKVVSFGFVPHGLCPVAGRAKILKQILTTFDDLLLLPRSRAEEHRGGDNGNPYGPS